MGAGDTPSDNNQLFKNNIYSSICSLGHEVHLVHFDQFVGSLVNKSSLSKKQKLEEFILDQYKEFGPFDYFLGFLDDLFVTPLLYKELKNEVFTINWSCNSHMFDVLHKNISPFVDLNTYISKNHKDLYDSVGAKSFWSPMAASDQIYKPMKIQDIDISFIGSAYGNRPYYLWRLLQYGVPLKIFGTGWKFENNLRNNLKLYIAPVLYNFYQRNNLLNNLDKIKRINIIKLISDLTEVGLNVTDAEYPKVLARSRVSLNFPESRRNHDYLNPEVTFGCNFRDFEIPLSGSMLMTQDSDELDYFYERNKEVIGFGNETDMLEKAKYYSSHHLEAEKIAIKGYERAKAEHTWQNRFDDLFYYLEN